MAGVYTEKDTMASLPGTSSEVSIYRMCYGIEMSRIGQHLVACRRSGLGVAFSHGSNQSSEGMLGRTKCRRKQCQSLTIYQALNCEPVAWLVLGGHFLISLLQSFLEEGTIIIPV